MTELLLKLFVKNYRSVQSPAVRSAIGTLAGITGIVCNALLFLGKLTAGLLSGSISILADAFNNLTDAASSVSTLLGFQMARQPADKDHPYGHARYEYLSGLVVAALILLIGAELVQSSVSKIIHPQAMDVSAVTYGVLLCSMAVKFWMSLFFRTLGKRIGSATLTATAADSRNDVIATGAVLAGCLSQQLLNVNLDGFVGLAVAVFILWSGCGIAKETISPLIGQQADRELLSRIHRLILRHDKVLGIHDLLVHDYGPGQCFASVHVEISAEESPLVSHDIIDDIERDALAELNVHLVIHYDPVLHDSEQDRLHNVMVQILEQISGELSMHDFRLLRSGNENTLYFDLEVPYTMKRTSEELKQLIDEKLRKTEPHCTTVISFDGKE